MAEIRLLPASIDTPPTSEVGSQSTSLVLANRQATALRTPAQSKTPEIQDGYIWSVSVADDGSFNFYSVPRNAAGKTGSSQWQGDSSRTSNSSWSSFPMQSAAAQYAFYASISTSSYSHVLDVYA